MDTGIFENGHWNLDRPFQSSETRFPVLDRLHHIHCPMWSLARCPAVQCTCHAHLLHWYSLHACLVQVDFLAMASDTLITQCSIRGKPTRCLSPCSSLHYIGTCANTLPRPEKQFSGSVSFYPLQLLCRQAAASQPRAALTSMPVRVLCFTQACCACSVLHTGLLCVFCALHRPAVDTSLGL